MIFLHKIPPQLDYHNINSKVSNFNQLLFERFSDTEEHISVIDTISPESRFYYQDGLHLNHAGLTKLCTIILSNLYRVLALASCRNITCSGLHIANLNVNVMFPPAKHSN